MVAGSIPAVRVLCFECESFNVYDSISKDDCECVVVFVPRLFLFGTDLQLISAVHLSDIDSVCFAFRC